MLIESATARAGYLNRILGLPYRLGASGPGEFDCYGLARHLQEVFWGREMPVFEAPEESGRFAIAAMIAAHPEREQWGPIPRPVDGCLVSMAKQTIGYHLGTFINLDGGVICHALESPGVTVDRAFGLDALGWRKIIFWNPR